MTSGPLSAKLSTLGQTSSYATDEGERLMKEKGKCGKKNKNPVNIRFIAKTSEIYLRTSHLMLC